MTFTNQFEANDKNICYYRAAYSPLVFDSLSLDDKRALIEFTVNEFSKDVSVTYSNEMDYEIGALTEQDILLINNKMLEQSVDPYSLDLYLFLYTVLMKRFVARRKNYVPVSETSYFNKKYKKEEYKSLLLDIIILHMLLDELLELKKLVSLDESEKIKVNKMIETSSEQLSLFPPKEAESFIEIPKEPMTLHLENINEINRGGR